MKLILDTDRCQGHARCIVTTPDAFIWIEDRDQASPAPGAGAIPVDALEAAVRACPERAISLSPGQDDSDELDI